MKHAFFLILFVAILSGAGCSKKAANVVETANTNTNTEVAAPVKIDEITDPTVALAEGNRLMDENDTANAILAYQQAIKLDPELPESYFRLGIAYDLLEMQKKYSGEVVDDAPAASNKKVKGKDKGKDKDDDRPRTESEKAFETAVKKYTKWLDAHPEDDAAFYYLGRTYSKLGEDEDAEKVFKEAVKLKPEDTEYQTEYGSILMRLAKYHEAIEPLKKAVELDASNARAQDLLEDAQAGRQRMDYAIQKLKEQMNNTNSELSNSDSGRKGSGSTSTSNSNTGAAPSSNSNSAPKGPDEHTKPKVEPPKETKENKDNNKEKKDKKGGKSSSDHN